MKKVLISIVLVCTVFNGFTQNNIEKIKELIQVSGVGEEILQMQAIFSAKLAEKKVSFSDEEEFNNFSKIMQSSFNSTSTEKYLVEYLEDNVSIDSLISIIAIFDNPMIQSMQKIELAANNPDRQQDKMNFFQNMKKSPLPQERIQLLVNLNNELEVANKIKSMLENIMFSIAKGININEPKEKQVTEKSLKTKIPSHIYQQINNQIIALSMYTYKDISNDDLKEYLNIWMTPIAKYYIKILFEGYDYSFSKMGENLGKGLTSN